MEHRSPFTHILVPTDGSDTSINAGLLAIQIAAIHRAQITFIYVVDQIVVDGIASATSRSIEVVGKGGGLLLAPSHGIQPDVPLRNLRAFYETLRPENKALYAQMVN